MTHLIFNIIIVVEKILQIIEKRKNLLIYVEGNHHPTKRRQKIKNLQDTIVTIIIKNVKDVVLVKLFMIQEENLVRIHEKQVHINAVIPVPRHINELIIVHVL